MEIKSAKALEDAICELINGYVAGDYEPGDGVKVNVVDDDTVEVCVVEDADEQDDDDVYPFVDFLCYSGDGAEGMDTCIDDEYLTEVAKDYYPEAE